MLSYEYIQFLNEKILEYLPHDKIKVGDKYNFRCPICGDSRKSKRKRRGWFYSKSSSFFCFNCGTGLSGIKFLEFLSGDDYDEIKKQYLRLFVKSKRDRSLSAYYQPPTHEPSLFDLKPIVKQEWKNPLTDKARQYLADRLVTDAPFFTEKLYSWKNQKGNEYILIPWQINGIDAYFQLNDFQKNGSLKYIFPKDQKKLVAGLDKIDISWPYIICFEGFYDSLFVKNGICVGTKSITDYQLSLIKERFPRHNIVISFDNDDAGLQSMTKIIQKQNDFKFFKWFEKDTKHKDINDFVKNSGDVNIFTDKNKLEHMIIDKLVMKMWLMKNKKWKKDF